MLFQKTRGTLTFVVNDLLMKINRKTLDFLLMSAELRIRVK